MTTNSPAPEFIDLDQMFDEAAKEYVTVPFRGKEWKFHSFSSLSRKEARERAAYVAKVSQIFIPKEERDPDWVMDESATPLDVWLSEMLSNKREKNKFLALFEDLPLSAETAFFARYLQELNAGSQGEH